MVINYNFWGSFGNQGEAEPTNLRNEHGDTDESLKTMIESKTDNSIVPHNWIQFSIVCNPKLHPDNITKNGSTTVSWIATEKDA